MGSTIRKAIILRHPAPYSIKYSEECAASCEQHGIPYEFFDGYYTTDVNELNAQSGWRFPNAWVKEYCCTAGHLNIWRKVMQEDGAVAVLEHDAIVKRRLDDIVVEDGSILFLGLRVESRNDYECPEGPISQLRINTFEGTHAYALTPVTARRCVNNMASLREFPCPIDGLMGIHNVISQRMYLTDPSPVICEVGGRKSFTQFESARYNVVHPPGFMSGLKNKERYAYDPHRQRVIFHGDKDYKFSNDGYTTAIPFLQRVLEKVNINKNDPLNIFEVGSFEGAITTWLCTHYMGNPYSIMYCCDTFAGHEIEMIPGDIHSRATMQERFQYNVNLTSSRLQSYMLINDSKIALPDMVKQKPATIDIFYIDGGKDEQTIRSDISNAYALLKKNAVMILNDIQDSVSIIDQFVETSNLELIDSTETQRAYVKR